MPARKCVRCDVGYPCSPDYAKCPQCGRQTYFYAGTPAMAVEKAIEIKQRCERQSAFEAFYVEHAVAELQLELDQWAADCATLGQLPTQEVPE